MPETPQNPRRLLLLEDDPDDADIVKRLVAPAWQVEHVDHLSKALARLGQHGIDVVLSDLHLPDAKGLDTVQAIRTRFPLVPMVVMTSSFDEARATEAIQRGVQDYVYKDQLDTCGLERILRYAIERRHAEREREELLGLLGSKVAELDAALAKVQVLSGFLPMCAGCKDIRNDEGYWNDVAVYISNHTDALITHALCPKCLQERYPDFADDVRRRTSGGGDT